MSRKEDDILLAYEDLHREFFSAMSSKEFRIGQKIVHLIDSLKKGEIISFLKTEINHRRIARYNRNLPISDFRYGNITTPKPRIAVYSCVVGGYDKIQCPKLTFENIDFILFTDDTSMKIPIWEVRPLPPEALKQPNDSLKNRWCKMHPHIVGDNYDFAIYIDGNICVYSDMTNMVTSIRPQTGLAIHRHNVRNCIYDEFEVCKIAKRGDTRLMEKQINRYKQEGFPQDFGLFENTIIITDTRNNVARQILNMCWQELEHESGRDQLALPFVVWKMGYTIDDIGNLGYGLTNNPKFRKEKHLS